MGAGTGREVRFHIATSPSPTMIVERPSPRTTATPIETVSVNISNPIYSGQNT